MYLAYFILFVQQIMIYFVYNFDMRVAQEENVHGNVHATIFFSFFECRWKFCPAGGANGKVKVSPITFMLLKL